MSTRFVLVSKKKSGKITKIEQRKFEKFEPELKIKKNFTTFLEDIFHDVLNSQKSTE